MWQACDPGGRQKAVPAALYCSLGAGCLHWLSQQYDWSNFTRRTLVWMDLLDDEGEPTNPYFTGISNAPPFHEMASLLSTSSNAFLRIVVFQAS